jgi:hypothetical protein
MIKKNFKTGAPGNQFVILYDRELMSEMLKSEFLSYEYIFDNILESLTKSLVESCTIVESEEVQND